MDTLGFDSPSTPWAKRRVLWLFVTLGVVALLVAVLVMPAMARVGSMSEQGEPPMPMHGTGLAASYKFASQFMAAPGEALTYTIRLVNTGMTQTVADVTDRLPVETTFISGTADHGGVYDPISQTLAWRGITVPMRNEVSLTFVVTMNAVTAPKLVNNTAIISAGHELLYRHAWVTLMPTPPMHGGNLYPSHKFVSRHTAIPGETLTYTIWLVNAGHADAVANVTDRLPAQVSFVDGSATGGGVFDPVSGTLSWQGITVPMRSPVKLTFAVTAGSTTTPTLVTNTAVISTSDQSFERQAWFLLLPERPAPRPNLNPSHKIASRHIVMPGDLFTYTVRLRNVGTADAVANVTDQVPTLLNYVNGSANQGGVFDAGTGSVSWNGVTVPMKSDVSLTFAVTASVVTSPTLITNTAVISTGTDSLQRMARVLLVPSRPEVDSTPPVVQNLTIDDVDVLTSPTVTLYISATDNVGVRMMYLREWQWMRMPWPHWGISRSSGWVPYSETYTWTLGSEPGTHFVGVWVADAARNTSRLNRNAIDFASLLVPGAAIPRSGATPYLVYYDAGVDVNAVLTPITGDASLFVWYTDHLTRPIATSSQVVTFTTPAAGVYLFIAHGEPGATYDLLITPEGGPRPPVRPGPLYADSTGADVWAQAAQADPSALEASDLIALLTESALYPPDLADAPSSNVVYLPIVMR